MAWPSAAERARTAFDLAIVSVLLDAGAGPNWQFRYPVSGETIGRSEGLALASLVMFRDCEFSMWPSHPLRVDADRSWPDLTEAKLIRGFQVSDDNPLQGVAGRADLLRRLGRTVMAAPEIFGRNDTPRPGGLFDHLAALAENKRIAAPVILSELLTHLGPIWPSRLTLGGVALGDCWKHSALKTDDETNGLVPLHKLSQWLVLFADRAAAMGRHRGDRHRRAHRPRGIPQRRAVHRHRRAGAARSRPRRNASTPSIPSWWWNGAR